MRFYTINLFISCVVVLVAACGGSGDDPANDVNGSNSVNSLNSSNNANSVGLDAGSDAGFDQGAPDLGPADMSSVDMGTVDLGADSGSILDLGMDLGDDAGVSVDLGQDVGADAGTELTWSNGISAIFAAECVRCHTWAASYPQVVAKIENEGLAGRVSSGHKGVSGAEQAALLAWIANGYPEN